MYAIVKAGGHQEKVEVGDVILVNRLNAKKGDTVEFPAALVPTQYMSVLPKLRCQV